MYKTLKKPLNLESSRWTRAGVPTGQGIFSSSASHNNELSWHGLCQKCCLGSGAGETNPVSPHRACKQASKDHT